MLRSDVIIPPAYLKVYLLRSDAKHSLTYPRFFLYLSSVERYNLYLKEKQLKALEKLSKDTEEPVSRIIRDAIDKYLKGK